MKKVNKILACIDLSPYSGLTLEYASMLAQDRGDCRIIALNIINQRDISGIDLVGRYYPNTINVESYIRDRKQERRERVDTLIQETLGECPAFVSVHVDAGIPSDCILNAIASENIDLVVMANKGRGNLNRFLFGSVAEKVFRHSPVTVVSVRDENRFGRR